MQTGIAASSISSTIASADRLLLAVEADDEARGHEKTGGVEPVDALGDAAPRVLLLAHRDQRRGVGTFDADEDADEIGALHQHQELGIVGEIERGFGGELERIVVRFEPRCEFRQERLDGLLVADEVVVDEVDVAAIAEAIERVELREHLRVGLGARHAPVELDDVAELAGERAAARELHADVQVVVEFQEIEARDRRLGHVDLKFLRLELPFTRARFPGFDEFVDDSSASPRTRKSAV